MLGNGAPRIGPSATNSAAGSTSTNDLNSQHQAQFNRGIWPAGTTTFQTNGITVPITDSTSIFAPGFTQTAAAASSSPFIPTLPFEFVKNWNTGVGFSQANSSIFVQSHTATAAADFLNCTTSAASATITTAPSSIKKSVDIGKWEAAASLIEPLQIHLPVTSFNTTTAPAIKSENISSGSSSSSTSSKTPTSSCNSSGSGYKKNSSKSSKGIKNINDCILNLHQHHQNKSNEGTKLEISGTGCSRTLPIAWNSNLHTDGTGTTGTLLQIKREPCQVSEVTTSNNLLATTSFSAGTPTIIKIEQKSPTSTSQSNIASITSSSVNMDSGNNNSGHIGATTSQAIPIGIAVGRQRLQETTTTSQTTSASHLQAKDLNRFGLGLDLGCAATPNLSQNMFFTGTTIPLTDVMHQNHQSVAMNRTPPTLFQYPTMPMEIPTTLPPPVGFQLVRDPSTGQFLFLPAATTIEPIPQALVWPTFPQATASTTAGLQPPHLLLPPLQQSLQPPPPLALLGSDYLTASTTLHQSHLQHTSTHSTRLVALTSDTSKRTKTQQTTTTVPLPLPAAHALIKIEDGGHHHHQPTATTAAIFEQEKSIQTASIATAVQTPTEISGQLFYQHPGLIQIAPQSQPTVTVPTSAITMESTECRHLSSPPPLQLTAAAQAAIAAHSANASISDTQLSHIVQQQHQPEVQDANIQTSPIMSEDDNSSGHDGVMVETNVAEFCDEESQEHNEKPIVKLNEPEVTREEIAEHRESVPDTSVTSSSLIVNIKQQIESPDTSEMISKDNDAEPSQSQQLEEQREPVDLSGLQLLSNSIDVFQKKIIKQEPNDQLQITSPTIASTTITPPISEIAARIEEKPLVEIPKGIPEDLGGLNLLCALAEQRLEEDFQSSGNTPPSPSTEEIEMNLATNSSIKKRKHKVKSSKKKHKEEKKAKKRKHSEDDDELKDEMAASLKRVKTKFDNLPITSVDDVFRLMENDMKEKLANITRQCEEKRRELKQIKSTDGNEKTDSNNEQQQTTTNSAIKPAKVSYSSNTSTPLKFSIIPALSPSFSSSSNSESLVDIPKLSSDTDSGSKDDGSERSKRKFSIPNKNHGDKQGTETIVAKKSKSFVDYILASKQKLLQVTSTQVSSTLTTNSPTIDSWTSSIKNGKASLPFVKQEDQDGRGILKESAFKDERVFSIFGDGNSQKFQASSPLTLPSVSRPQQSFVKHHSSKHKKHKERKRHRDRQRLDSRVKINAEHLKQAKTRVLMAQGGLFYAGTLTPVEPLEVYAITLDGERGNRPHIMPREEILKQAILEIQPKTTAECPPGTRLCAYWSQQYRCLYPGVATIPSSPDSDVDEKYVNVEFDDGDSGRIVLEHIRFLFSDYPIVEYDPNPLQSLNKRKRQSSHAPSSDHDQKITQQSTNEVSLSREERKRLKKIRKEKNRLQSSPDHAQDSFVVEHKKKKKHKCHDDDLCKHRKHKKRRKKNHKKHHHRELEEEDRELQHHVQSAMLISSNDSNNNEEEFDEESSLNESVAQYEIVKKVDQEALIKDDPDTMESSPSTVTESSGSLYTPKKSTSTEKLNRSNESGSKIAAFLPARQLWAWSGKGFKRSTGRVKKQFYRSIQRGKETISVGDSAVFLSTGRPDRPYIGHIESMWETANGHMVVRVKWFYHPEETQGCPNLKYPGALFESPHEDENDVQTISHKCEVLPLEAYVNKFGDDPKQYESIYDNNDTYYLAGSYDPTLYHIKMQQEIPVLHENEKWI